MLEIQYNFMNNNIALFKFTNTLKSSFCCFDLIMSTNHFETVAILLKLYLLFIIILYKKQKSYVLNKTFLFFSKFTVLT